MSIVMVLEILLHDPVVCFMLIGFWALIIDIEKNLLDYDE